MSPPEVRFTYEDYRLLPEDKRYELMEGELLVTPAPTSRHQRVHAKLMNRLMNHVEPAGLGLVMSAPSDVILSDENVVQPDILFITTERTGIIDWDGGIHGAPDLIVEILSPSTAGRDQVLKRKLYGKYGVREYWVVDPAAASIEVLTLGPAGLETARVFPTGSTLASALLPTLPLKVDEIFTI